MLQLSYDARKISIPVVLSEVYDKKNIYPDDNSFYSFKIIHYFVKKPFSSCTKSIQHEFFSVTMEIKAVPRTKTDKNE